MQIIGTSFVTLYVYVFHSMYVIMTNKMDTNNSFLYLKTLMPSILCDIVITLYVYILGGKQSYKRRLKFCRFVDTFSLSISSTIIGFGTLNL